MCCLVFYFSRGFWAGVEDLVWCFWEFLADDLVRVRKGFLGIYDLGVGSRFEGFEREGGGFLFCMCFVDWGDGETAWDG